MSSKGKNVPDSKGGKNSTQSRKKNPRRSQRHLSNGDPDETKERASKRGRDSNKDFDGNYEAEFPQELYKVRWLFLLSNSLANRKGFMNASINANTAKGIGFEFTSVGRRKMSSSMSASMR